MWRAGFRCDRANVWQPLLLHQTGCANPAETVQDAGWSSRDALAIIDKPDGHCTMTSQPSFGSLFAAEGQTSTICRRSRRRPTSTTRMVRCLTDRSGVALHGGQSRDDSWYSVATWLNRRRSRTISGSWAGDSCWALRDGILLVVAVKLQTCKRTLKVEQSTFVYLTT
jgi:hypothetical protein